MELKPDTIEELREARARKLMEYGLAGITHEVTVAVEELFPGAMDALQNLGSDRDVHIYDLWSEAVRSAKTSDALINAGEDEAADEIRPYGAVVRLIAHRVAGAILVIHGYIDLPTQGIVRRGAPRPEDCNPC